jgi:hypothetical protein
MFVVGLIVWSTSAFGAPDARRLRLPVLRAVNIESGRRMEEMDRHVDKRFQRMADFDSAKCGWTKGKWQDALLPISARGKGI